MSEQTSYNPSESELKQAEEIMTSEQRELSEQREYILARIKTSEGGNETIKTAREIGVEEKDLKKFVLGFLEKDIKEGYGLDTVRSIAKNSGVVVTEAEIDALFKKIQAEMEVVKTIPKTVEEVEAENAAFAAEMLKLYE